MPADSDPPAPPPLRTAATTWSAEPFLPADRSLRGLRLAAEGCEGCDLYVCGTQTVFGEGAPDARVVFVGEQPGDQEDVAGRPFVGPAGRLLDEALDAVGIDRDSVYVTNAVKHFKWTPKGKRRIHAKPDLLEVAACRPWLVAELDVIRPQLVVCLGATAAQSLLGKDFRVTRQRGEFRPWPAAGTASAYGEITATVHPSSILRAGDRRAGEMELFVADLRLVAERVSG
jgi:DNA polymerase